MLRRIVVVITVWVPVGLSVAGASAAACPNEAFRGENGMTSLPDCRAYEQVSPVEKNGADVLGYETNVRAAANGKRVTFASYGGFDGAQGLKTFEPYLGSSSGDGWQTSALYPPQEEKGTAFFNLLPQPLGYSENLNSVVLGLGQPSPVPGAEPNTENLYLRDLDTNAYSLLTSAGVTNFHDVGFSAGSRDFSHLLFESGAKLTPDAPIDNPEASGLEPLNLYESVNGQVRLVSILPNGVAAPQGGRAGSIVNGSLGGGGIAHAYTQNTISADGSRVFWTDSATLQLYVRIDGIETVQVSASHRTAPEAPQPAFFRGATPDGSIVFFTSGEKLTNDSTAAGGSGPRAEGDLYAYDVESRELTDLTAAEAGNAHVIGMLGASDDGLSVYFVADGEPLVGGAPTKAELEASGSANLYERHGSDLTYIATIGTNSPEAYDWSTGTFVNIESKLSRVTPGGSDLLFGSARQLTAYDNAGQFEFYRYDAPSKQIACVSCNPSGEPATEGASLGTGAPEAQATLQMAPFPTNVLSADGRRVFFQTRESLVSSDSNGRLDVYEWEEGQLHLISSGQTATDSVLGDASSSGDDVFFVTRQQLVGQDTDQNADMYDARVNGGIPSQNPPASGSSCVGDACYAPSPPPPGLALSGSATFSGPGNLVPTPTNAPAKPKPRPLTRAQKLARALKACHAKSKKRRAGCEKLARKRYGPIKKARHARKSNTKTSSRRAKP